MSEQPEKTPRRRRTDPWPVRVLLGVVGLVATSGTGYYSASTIIGERMRAVEVRQEEQYKALAAQLGVLQAEIVTLKSDVKADLNQTRGEIMGILRVR